MAVIRTLILRNVSGIVSFHELSSTVTSRLHQQHSCNHPADLPFHPICFVRHNVQPLHHGLPRRREILLLIAPPKCYDELFLRVLESSYLWDLRDRSGILELSGEITGKRICRRSKESFDRKQLHGIYRESAVIGRQPTRSKDELIHSL